MFCTLKSTSRLIPGVEEEEEEAEVEVEEAGLQQEHLLRRRKQGRHPLKSTVTPMKYRHSHHGMFMVVDSSL